MNEIYLPIPPEVVEEALVAEAPAMQFSGEQSAMHVEPAMSATSAITSTSSHHTEIPKMSSHHSTDHRYHSSDKRRTCQCSLSTYPFRMTLCHREI